MTERVTIVRSIGGLEFDATFLETHTVEMEVTENPVEVGSLVSDHAFMKPLVLSITAGVSAVLLPSGNPSFGSGSDRPVTAYQALTDLQATREPFDVETGLVSYENMVITRIVNSQDKDSSGVLQFTAQLREVILTETETVRYPPRKEGTTKNQADKTVDRGEQPAKGVEGGQKKSSFLNSAVSSFKGATGSSPSATK